MQTSDPHAERLGDWVVWSRRARSMKGDGPVRAREENCLLWKSETQQGALDSFEPV
jgi:hypothetical protein